MYCRKMSMARLHFGRDDQGTKTSVVPDTLPCRTRSKASIEIGGCDHDLLVVQVGVHQRDGCGVGDLFDPTAMRPSSKTRHYDPRSGPLAIAFANRAFKFTIRACNLIHQTGRLFDSRWINVTPGAISLPSPSYVSRAYSWYVTSCRRPCTSQQSKVIVIPNDFAPPFQSF